MLQAYVLEFKDSWVKHLSLVEFAYNNNDQASIGMAPYEALYGKNAKLQYVGMKSVNRSLMT